MIRRFCGRKLLVFVGMLGICWGHPATAQPPVSYATIGDQAAELEARAEAALSRQVSVDFVDTPLRDFAAEIRRLAGVNCVLKIVQLAEATIQVDHPVNVTLSNVSIDTVLRHALRAIELSYLVEDGVVLITSREDSQQPQNLVTRIYPVRDLVVTHSMANNRARFDFMPLMDLITSTVEPDSWQDVGGPASVAGSGNSDILVIVQRRDIHERIGALLSTLRKVRRIQNLSPLSPSNPAAVAEMPTGKLSRSLPVRSRGSSSVLQAPPANTSAWQLPQLYSGR